MKPSLQKIEDYYIRKGFRGDKLRKILESDKEYQKILTERKRGLTKKFSISKNEEKKYVLSTDNDHEILGKIHELEKKKLSESDKELVEFIRTQLEEDWRTPLVEVLDKLMKKY